MIVELFYSPGSCARVTAIALEEAQIDFKIRLVRLGQGEQKSSEFLSINPKARVPVLTVGGAVLTENVAIISYLNEAYPSANLLPSAETSLDRARQIADLCFCSSTLHPVVTRICIPRFFVDDAVAHAAVKDSAIEAMRFHFGLVEERLNKQEWWYDRWSVVDAYLFWIWSRVHGCGFPTQEFAAFSQHAAKVERRPSVQRALRREQQALDQLRSEGLAVMPAPPLH
jgi:glutathione S-transferase